MERGVKRRTRRRLPLPFLLLAVVVVGCAFAVAVAAVVPMEADSPGGRGGNADTYARPIHTGRSGS